MRTLPNRFVELSSVSVGERSFIPSVDEVLNDFKPRVARGGSYCLRRAVGVLKGYGASFHVLETQGAFADSKDNVIAVERIRIDIAVRNFDDVFAAVVGDNVVAAFVDVDFFIAAAG